MEMGATVAHVDDAWQIAFFHVKLNNRASKKEYD